MSSKNKKQFGVWMDSHHATIVGREDSEDGGFTVLGHVKSEKAAPNSSEKTANNEEIALTHKFFKEIAGKMPNIDEIHLTGTGQVQEQFMKYLAETAQYKNAVSTESTANKMSDENLALFIAKHFEG